MKNSKLFSLILILAAALFSVQCTTDPIQGPPGENGVDGVDGVDGIDGVNGTTECAACHNVATSEEVHASYLFSAHSNNGFALNYAGKRGDCAECHSNEGFVDYMDFGMVPEDGYQSVTPIGCTTCHNKHTSFDFEKDGFDYALRGLAPVTLIHDPDGYTIDYGSDKITSHMCVICHQPRDTFEANINGDGTVDVGGRFGPHYGAQSTLLEGIQGAELAGYEYRRTDGSSLHRSGSSCTNCHMGESTTADEGLHSTNWTETSCTTCHDTSVPTVVTGYEEAYQTLENLLLAEGLLEIDENGEPSIVPNPNADLIPAAALWNYRMLYYDHSDGVHNPLYATDLIQNSIDALNGN